MPEEEKNQDPVVPSFVESLIPVMSMMGIDVESLIKEVLPFLAALGKKYDKMLDELIETAQAQRDAAEQQFKAAAASAAAAASYNANQTHLKEVLDDAKVSDQKRSGGPGRVKNEPGA